MTLDEDAKMGPTRRRLYVDTSAYLCMLLGEDGSEELRRETSGAELLSSVLLLLEARRNLVRLAREGLLLPDQYQTCVEFLDEDVDLFVLRDLTLDICRSSTVPAVVTPRSLDLAHLRTALWFHAEEKIDRFITIDLAQERAAKELGLPV
jgi:predicted nucleic acid-binding protein